MRGPTGPSNTLCVVPCGKAKVWDANPLRGPVPADRAYTGPFASALRRYAQAFHRGDWVVLSAKHGFLLPGDMVPGPYEVTFNRPNDPGVVAREVLVAQATGMGLLRYRRVVVLAGAAYAKRVKEVFAPSTHVVTTPLVGLGGMGHMLSAVLQAVREGRPLARSGC